MGAIMVAEMVGYTDDGMTLDEAIAAYLAACDVEGKSPRTVDAYAETLGMFHSCCQHLRRDPFSFRRLAAS